MKKPQQQQGKAPPETQTPPGQVPGDGKQEPKIMTWWLRRGCCCCLFRCFVRLQVWLVLNGCFTFRLHNGLRPNLNGPVQCFMVEYEKEQITDRTMMVERQSQEKKCLIISGPILPYRISFYLILSCLILSHLILSYLTFSYLILFCLILSYFILSYLLLSYFILSYLFLLSFLFYFLLSYLVLSCLVLSYLTLSYVIWFHFGISYLILL